tara:strand:- start:18 stop:776 length:759 start_codon:yes stop_codon:yes gene_type:complete
MKDRYFSVEVKPTIAASKQNTAAFSAGDVLFDWVEFEIPKGTSRLIGATMIVRPKGNNTPTGNKFGSFLVFSKTNTISYGIVNSAPTTTPSNDFLGFIEIAEEDNFTQGAGTAIGMAGRGSNNDSIQPNLLLTGSQTGSNVGYDKLYMAAQALGAFDFTSVIAIAEAGAADAASTQVITTDGTVDESKILAVGDVLHIGTEVGAAAADSLIGTVAAVADNLVTLEAVSPTALVDGDILYNINPIRVILHFEK